MINYTLSELRSVQEYFGFPRSAPVEKDWHVVHALKAINSTDTSPFKLVFAGGTCLARAHHLISRMSEDADFKVILDTPEPISRVVLRKQLGTLRDKITQSLQAAGFIFNPESTDNLRSRNENHYTIYQLPYSGTEEEHGVLRPIIQIELTYTKQLRQPTITLPVASFINEAFKRPHEIPSITCISITETAAEKLVSITRRTAAELAGVSRDIDPTLVRHIYDLHIIHEHIDTNTVIELARTIALEDAIIFKNQYPAYQSDITGETQKAIAALASNPIFKERYQHFIAAMVYGQQPAYEEALATLSALTKCL